jgi:hypothetical protein
LWKTGAYDLRREHYRLVPARRYLYGEDLERREARQPSVEQTIKFELIINLKLRRRSRLTIPPSVLAELIK